MKIIFKVIPHFCSMSLNSSLYFMRAAELATLQMLTSHMCYIGGGFRSFSTMSYFKFFLAPRLLLEISHDIFLTYSLIVSVLAFTFY